MLYYKVKTMMNTVRIAVNRHKAPSAALMALNALAAALLACNQVEPEPPAPAPALDYGEEAYALKVYLVERHPPVVRNGFGMDIFHLGGGAMDTLYLDRELPPWHPNNPSPDGALPVRFYTDTLTGALAEAPFAYDLLFYNEFAYVPQSTGDYSYTGYPVIFLYTDPEDEASSVAAAMVGQGRACFEAFSADSVPAYLAALRRDPPIALDTLRTELNARTTDGVVEGSILLQESVRELYRSLTIGNKFRPNIGGVFASAEADAEQQDQLQPVFLIRTREGLYAKFMVTRFKGVGADTQRLTLQWQGLRTE
jgi:hypothetical protein